MMKEFFASTKFKILCALMVVMFAFMLRATLSGGASPLTNELIGIITTPISDLSSDISDSVTNFFSKFLRAGQISEENAMLREEIRRLNEKLVDFEKYRHENESLRGYLGVKETNPDFVFETAEVIQRDPNDRFSSFIIDKGSNAGVQPQDPVITADGLVGRVSEVGLTYSKVTTILDVGLEVGAYDVRTRDAGLLVGDMELAEQGMCRLGLLPRESVASKGDILLTTGIGGVFPKDIIIGKISEVATETHGKSLYAIVQPAADIRTVTDVLVITDFLGQGNTIEE